MTTYPVERLVCRMAVPTIISMLVTTFYNMVDTLFVGQLNTSATAAVGVVFPLMALIQAIGFFFGHGSGNYISRAIGRQEYDDAAMMASTGFFSALFSGVVITVVGMIFSNPLAYLLGAIETNISYVLDYMRYILIGAPFMTASLVLNNQLRHQGNAFFAMVGIASGAVLNIVLDPLFIFVFDMGVGGAALATVISQLVSFIALWIGCARSDNLNIKWKNFSPSFHRFRNIFGGGLPSLCRQGLNSVAVIALNHFAGNYGDTAIAAFSIVSRITAFSSSAMLGFGQGFQPVCGFNYGAGLYTRVKKAFWFCVKVATVALTLLMVAGLIFAPAIITLFRRDDAEVIRIGANVLRLQCLTFPFQGLVILSNMLLQNIGKTVRASLLSAARQGIFFLPALFLLLPLGMLGLELAQPIADVLSFVLAVPFTAGVMREMPADKTD